MIVEHLEAVLTEVLIISYEGDTDEETGEFHGQGIAKLDNDCSYEGGFLNGKLHGKGRFVWSNGLTFEGDFAHNCISGSGTYGYIDGSIYSGQVLNGKRHGNGKLVNSLQQVYEGEWKNGERHGVGRMSYNDDQTLVYHVSFVSPTQNHIALLMMCCFQGRLATQPASWLWCHSLSIRKYL
jgi:hypothetical protein